ncbi:hypothetical protein ACRE_037890 [Hapsidospora chrysogenum ATCC 11550]|uniref:Uncharacterized protein n=1 Tax=Hapsidospora chrysogenum (strain ATCC 11550 / CBS 779.69 / DSM 880 / IAM 14645 / JCM 23072 / IMI 49137) TaxID=857340 RepID=A0A086T7U3_HAPC1|nr:hypothetical protein ACRE_037890 [Hapsidospora chrysogenum ATCC 11550]
MTVSGDTNYPSSDQLAYAVESGTDFAIFICVAEWTIADKATINVGDGETKHLFPQRRPPPGSQDQAGHPKHHSDAPNGRQKRGHRGDPVAFYRGPLLHAPDIAYR